MTQFKRTTYKGIRLTNNAMKKVTEMEKESQQCKIINMPDPPDLHQQPYKDAAIFNTFSVFVF